LHDYGYYTSIRFQAKPSRIGLIRRRHAQNEGERKLLWRLLRIGLAWDCLIFWRLSGPAVYRQGVDRNLARQQRRTVVAGVRAGRWGYGGSNSLKVSSLRPKVCSSRSSAGSSCLA
jgi:hypothetical protein